MKRLAISDVNYLDDANYIRDLFVAVLAVLRDH